MGCHASRFQNLDSVQSVVFGCLASLQFIEEDIFPTRFRPNLHRPSRYKSRREPMQFLLSPGTCPAASCWRYQAIQHTTSLENNRPSLEARPTSVSSSRCLAWLCERGLSQTMTLQRLHCRKTFQYSWTNSTYTAMMVG